MRGKIEMRKLCARKLRSRSQILRRVSTPQEMILWRQLRDKRLGLKFRRQAVIGDKYIVDFVCLEKNLVIEVDGSQHAESKADIERTNYLKERGFKVVRFWNNEVNENLKACLEVIYNCCK